jgi:hypothetical protein
MGGAGPCLSLTVRLQKGAWVHTPCHQSQIPLLQIFSEESVCFYRRICRIPYSTGEAVDL